MKECSLRAQRLIWIMLAAMLALGLDQASKLWVLHGLFGLPAPVSAGTRIWPINALPFFDWVLVWNYGVSFGLLRNHHEWMPYILSALALAIVISVLVWVRKQPDRLSWLGSGMICGGAIGNVIDRFRYGAVVDFLDFHAFGYHYPAFNVADSCIVCGVMILLLQTWRQDKKQSGAGSHPATDTDATQSAPTDIQDQFHG